MTEFILGLLVAGLAFACFMAGFDLGRKATIEEARRGSWVCLKGVCLKFEVIDTKNKDTD